MDYGGEDQCTQTIRNNRLATCGWQHGWKSVTAGLGCCGLWWTSAL